MKAYAASLFRGLQDPDAVRPTGPSPPRAPREADLGVLGDAVVAPAVPGLHHHGLATDQPLVERGVVVGEEVGLRVEHQLLDVLHLALVGGVDRVAERLLRRQHRPALGAHHRDLAAVLLLRLEQVVPAGGCLVDEVGAVADAGGAPRVRREVRLVVDLGEALGLGVQLVPVLQVVGVERLQQTLLGERLQVRLRAEDDVEPSPRSRPPWRPCPRWWRVR